jgi:hypothetical protein
MIFVIMELLYEPFEQSSYVVVLNWRLHFVICGLMFFKSPFVRLNVRDKNKNAMYLVNWKAVLLWWYLCWIYTYSNWPYEQKQTSLFHFFHKLLWTRTVTFHHKVSTILSVGVIFHQSKWLIITIAVVLYQIPWVNILMQQIDHLWECPSVILHQWLNAKTTDFISL